MSELEQQQALDTNKGEPTTPPVEAEPEGTIEAGGQRMAPVRAVIEERRGRQAAQKERDTLKAEAERLRAVEENWKLVEPYLPLLATHPKITGKPAPQQQQGQADPELTSIAETFGFYDTDGQPDLKRARAAQDYMDKRTGARVDERIAPVAQQAGNVRAQILRERAYNVVDKQGRPMASREAIDLVLNELPPDAQAQPEMVNMAILIARGMMSGAPAGEPLHTEDVGGRGRGAHALSKLEESAAKTRGIAPDAWVKMRDDDSLVLE